MVARKLTRTFGSTHAVRGVDLDVAYGESVVIFGHNGAGKTTLLKLLATLLRPTTGQLRLAGIDPTRDATGARRRIGVVAHQTYLYGDLTALENLIYYGRLYGLTQPEARGRQLLGRVGLGQRASARVGTLSRGQQQRVALARALLHEPPILLLDEPDTGLDADGQAVLADLIADHRAAGGTTVLTTHSVDRGLALADTAVLLTAGRLTRTAPTKEWA
ncbi:MAG: heme ABC exporter ATP-binding protein CcmA [Chloroflexi bacterium]|nr:heme ABC exporter ATP-binding protein CcmA [Chloroflexota bacterium]